MATGESSWKAMGSPGAIPPPTFDTLRRGHDPAQALEYVRRLTERLLVLELEVCRLHGELAQRELPAEHTLSSYDLYEDAGTRVADLVRTFDRDVERLRRDTEWEAGHLVAEARAEAERIRYEAQKMRREVEIEGDLTLTQARSEADRIRLDSQRGVEEASMQAAKARRDAQEFTKLLTGLATRRDALLAELRKIRDRMVSTVADLEATLEGAPQPADVVIVEPVEA
jgi:vacuolar-type H+-ATPase subunit H